MSPNQPSVLRRPTSNTKLSSQFVPKIAEIETLGTSTEQRRGHNFAKFLKSIHHHALTTFNNSKDISKAILDFTDPLAELQKETLSLSAIRKSNNLNPFPPKAEESESDQFIRESEYKNSERTPTRQYGQRSRPTLDMHDIYRSLNRMVRNFTSALL